jgi:glycosyltransferase involved in cell wall biosynthesis
LTKVSVIVPLYNKSCYIAETIRSVQSQAFADWELLIVDNGSTDDGPKIVTQLQASDGRIRLLSSDKRGPGSARNFGVSQAVGEWIQFLDADDLLEVNHLQSLVQIAADCPSASLVAGGWQEFPDGDLNQRTVRRPAGEGKSILDSAIATSPWAVHAAIIRRETLNRVFWPEEMDAMFAEDNVFWFSVCLNSNIAYSDSNGALYRIGAADSRSSDFNAQEWFDAIDFGIERNLETLRRTAGQLNPHQAATLMRIYSEASRLAAAQKDSGCRVLALRKASFWLHECVRAGHPWTLPLLARRVLGISVFERLKLVIGSPRRNLRDA